ncbi:MAG TPA: sirohydrochlorin chelatase [Propionibacteriaceae bacterium]
MGHRPDIEPSAGAGGFFVRPDATSGLATPPGPDTSPDSEALPITLIGLAHGSRHPGVAASIDDLMLATATAGGMPAVGAFLDLAEPDLATVAQRLADQGHRAAVVAPLLFTEAFHAKVDVPEAVREAGEASGLELVTAAVLGTGDDMLEVVVQSMAAAGVGPAHAVVLLAVGSSRVEANDAVLDLAARLANRRTGQVVAAFGTRSPRVADVLDDLTAPAAIVPLFLSPGLLLDPLEQLAASRGMVMAAPLGDLVAPLLVQRYQRALRTAASPLR